MDNSNLTTHKKVFFLLRPGVLFILLTGIILTACTFVLVRREIQKSAVRYFEKETIANTTLFTNRMKQHVASLGSIKYFFEFSDYVSREEFAGFTSSMLSERDGLKALLWVPRVSENQRISYETQAHAAGFEQFEFHSSQGHPLRGREAYFPIYYVEPFKENSTVLGYDLGDEKEVCDAVEKTLRTGQPASIMKSFPLEEKAGDVRHTLWVIMPVFDSHSVNYSESNRRQSLQGYIVGVVDFPMLVSSIWDEASNSLEVYLQDITDAQSSTPLLNVPVCSSQSFSEEGYSQDCRTPIKSRFEFTDRVLEICNVGNERFSGYGSEVWLAWLVPPVGGLLTGLLILYLYDLYRRNELANIIVEKRTRELNEQKNKADVIALEAERSDRAKSEFLASMSHDIRIPMNAVLGFCELLKEELLTDDQRYYVSIVYDSSKNLLTLLNDILDLSKIEVGKLHIEITNFNLSELLGGIERMFRVSAQNRGLDFQIIPSTTVPGTIRSDPVRIRQCLVNLIGNAVKFTHKGHVYVRATMMEGHLKLDVEDTGVGISETCMESIFNAFTQADNNPAPYCSGSGLGLTITRQLARLMGGDVTVQSRAGEGSIFTLDIPVGTTEDEPKQLPQEAGVSGGWGEA